MQQPKQGVEAAAEDRAGAIRLGTGAAQRNLRKLDVPVEELVPGEVEQRVAALPNSNTS